MTKITKRDALLKEGFDLIHKNGYHATGIQEITDAVNTSKGSFYNHFRKKEKFAIRLIEEFGVQLAKEHATALTDKSYTPFARIERFYLAKIDAVIHTEKFRKGCFISNMCQEEADKSDVIAKCINDAFEGMVIPLATCLAEAKESGEIAKGTDEMMLAEFILNSWNGALMRVKAARNDKALKAFASFLKSIKM